MQILPLLRGGEEGVILKKILYYCFDFDDSTSIVAHFLLFFRENRVFLLKKKNSDLDMFTQFEFEATIFELKQIQIMF